jgi:hypothetical protein
MTPPQRRRGFAAVAINAVAYRDASRIIASPWDHVLLLMLEAASANLVSPSAWSAAPKIFSYPASCRPITPSFGFTPQQRAELHGDY